MRRASLRTHSTDTRHHHQQPPLTQQILPTPSLSTQMRRPRPRSFSFDEQLSIIDDDDESIVHDMPFSVAPVRQQQQQQQQQIQPQHRRLNTSKVSSRCRTRRRRSRSLTKRTNNNRQTNPQQQQQQHEWLHTTENHHESTSSEEIDDEEDEVDDDDGENQAHFSPRSTSTAANRPRNRKPILHASDFDRRLCEATATIITSQIPINEQDNSSPINTDNIQHHTSPVSQPSTEPDDINLIVYSNNNNDLLNATIISRKSETNTSLKKISCHEKFLTIRYGSPDSGISGKT
jgi:hypothetical protein